MKIRIAICDDSTDDINMLEKMIVQIYERYSIEVSIRKYISGISMLKEYPVSEPYDAIFLDIEMPDCDGISIAKQIRDIPDKNTKLIYVSSYPGYMQQTFDVHAFHFITKPLDFAFVEKVLLQLKKELEEKDNKKLIIKTDKGEAVIHIEDIEYIETNSLKKGYLIYNMCNRTMLVKGRIMDIEEQYRKLGLYKCHRCYLVNINRIHAVEADNLIMDNNKIIPLSRSQAKEIKRQFAKNLANYKGE